MKAITILGSTGSIGVAALDVVNRLRDRFRIFGLVAGRNTEKLALQIRDFRPDFVAVASEDARKALIGNLKELGLDSSEWPELGYGPAGALAAAVAEPVDFVMSAIVGVAGLEATYEAIRLGKRIGLANKEVMVAAGSLVTAAAAAAQTELLPVDSEHNGIHQCLRGGRREEVTKLILTASGGPFRDTPSEAFESITPAQALKHPTWKMGRRITIDSATLMNKGFEVMEACWLFGFSPEQVDVVIHPESSVHAMVEYADGSVIAQISATDMRMPIQYALTYPARQEAPVPKMDWGNAKTWHFLPPSRQKFPLLELAYQAQRAGGSAGCTLNAADEVAVEEFLNERISFTAIFAVVEETLARIPIREPRGIGEILEIDRESRAVARQIAAERTSLTACLADSP